MSSANDGHFVQASVHEYSGLGSSNIVIALCAATYGRLAHDKNHMNVRNLFSIRPYDASIIEMQFI